MKTVNFCTAERTQLPESWFSEQCRQCMVRWENPRFQRKSHGLRKSAGASYGQDIMEPNENGKQNNGIFYRKAGPMHGDVYGLRFSHTYRNGDFEYECTQ